MDQMSVAPPPLPPKSRRSPPGSSATVLSDNNQVFYTDLNGIKSNKKEHVVKIRIDPNSDVSSKDKVISDAPYIRISVNNTEMIQNGTMVDASPSERSTPYFFYNPFNCSVMSSGQVSPSETLDSGMCSDLDVTTPVISKKKSPSGVSVTLIQHKRTSSLTSSADSDDNESSISCDSLNSGKISPTIKNDQNSNLPPTLLQDIRDRNAKLISADSITIKSYEERQNEEQKEMSNSLTYETDIFYKFHLNEQECDPVQVKKVVEDETFAGYKDILGDGASTIRSAKGTVRGVKNRVRAGIATFLQINSVAKNYKEKDAGKVVVYTTTMGVLRDTYQACMKVKQIMRTLLIKFEERDVFMSNEYQNEIKERMRCDYILVPQVFVDGQHVGDVETIERLNETGELRRILKPFKSMDACTTCKVCGGYRLLPCQVCNGSKKSVHRNHFTTEFVALKCMNCDEVGLVKCSAC